MGDFPSFPVFAKLEINHKTAFYKFTKNFPPFSDYNFVSIWSYDVEEDTQVSILNTNLVIRLRDYITNEPTYSYFGHNKPLETVQELFGYMEGIGAKPVLKLIPEINFIHHKKLIHEKFNVSEDRDSFDYIYSLEHLSKLPGKSYNSKRNKINRFLREYTKISVRLIDLKKRDNDNHILYVFSHWGGNRETEDTSHELKALNRLLKYASYLNLVCTGVYINEKLEGFTIVEPIANKFAVAHFTKADPKKNGIFEFLYKSMADELLKKGLFFFNREQDLGIEGLRAAKLSWRPIKFLKKYTISKKIN